MMRHRMSAVLRGVAAMVTLVGLTAGLPVALLKLGGSPIPSRLPSVHHIVVAALHRDGGGLLLGAIRDVSWLAWVAFTVAVVAEAQATARGRSAPRLHLAGLQGAAGRLVAVASLAFASPAAMAIVAPSALAATAGPAALRIPEVPAHPGTSVAVAGPAALRIPEAPAYPGAPAALAGWAAPRIPEEPAHPGALTAVAGSAAPESAAGGTSRTLPTVVVRPGDCLWTIAQRYLGDGDRYPEIARLNLGHAMGGGEVFTDPSLILPGWHLRLPPGASSVPGGPEHAHGGSEHSGGQRHDGHSSADPRFSGPHGGAAGAGAGSDGAHGATDAGGGSDGAGRPQAAGSTRAPGDPSAGRHQGIEQAALFTLGMLAGSAVASLGRLRHRQRQYRRSGRRIALPADEASVRVEQKLRAAAPLAPSETLRDTLMDLSKGAADSGDPLPPIVGVHLTGDAIEVLLSAPAAGPPPAPFSIAPARQAMCWIAPLRGTRRDESARPPAPGEIGDLLPGLFTAGATDSGGYLLLDLEAMRVTCCDGPDELTDRFLVTAVTELAASRWSGWYELVLAGCDELEVLGRAEQCGDLDEALDLLEARAATIADRMGDDDGEEDVRARRLADPEDEDWGLTLLVSRVPPDPAQMSRLLRLADGPGGVAALVAGDTRADGGKLAPALFRLEPDPDGPGGIIATITIAHLGPGREITVWPQTLTVSEYESLAGILATAADIDDVSPTKPPYLDHVGPPWMRLSAAPVRQFPPETEEEEETGEAGYDGVDDLAGGPSGDGFARPVAGPDPGLHAESWAGQDQDYADEPAPDCEDRLAAPDETAPGLGDRLTALYEAAPGLGDRPAPSDEATPDWGDRLAAPDEAHQAVPRPYGSWRHDSAVRPRPVLDLEVRVLGPVEILGSASVLQSKQAELILALALNGPAGLSNSELCGLLGPDADHPRPGDSVRQLITRTRRRLGPAPDGQEYVIHLGSGIYVPHPAIGLDWARFTGLATRGRAERDIGELRAAMALVRGQPFADCFHWWIEVALIEAIRAEIVDTAELLARLELAAGDPHAARRAARAGLAAETAAEQLWRALMRAEHEAGNPAGVVAAWTGCLDAISQIAPGGEPHPDTARLYRQLTSPLLAGQR